MNRRELLKGLMAGGMIVAGELWVPGQKLISIPSKINWYTDKLFEFDGQTISYVGPEHKTATIEQFYNWLQSIYDGPSIMGENPDMPNMVSLEKGYRMTNPEHLTHGTLAQDAPNTHGLSEQREVWVDMCGLGDADMEAYHVYTDEFDTPPKVFDRTEKKWIIAGEPW